MKTAYSGQRLWWERKDVEYRNGRLFFGNQDLLEFVQSAGTPVYAYNSGRIKDNLTRLATHLDHAGVCFKVFYALKANRFLPLVTYLKLLGQCGVDVCSPAELKLARQVGYGDEEITYTGTSVANEDLDCLQKHPGVQVNCDAISTIKRLGQRCPGRTIGIRINPGLGAGYNETLCYAGDKPTKFGVYRERYLEALETADAYNLQVKTLHFHIGSGYLTPDIAIVDNILKRCHWFLDNCPSIDTLDVGGGLGVPLVEGQKPLDLANWARTIATHARKRELVIHLEPGDYLVKDAGILILQVNTVEEKGNIEFVGVNGGFNIHSAAAYYDIPFIVAPLRIDASASWQKKTVAGNINEAIDLLAKDVFLPPIQEGDYLALLNAGGYGSAISSNHCMRGEFSEYLIVDSDSRMRTVHG
jgi:diaminopimelate decarboxylase